MMIDRWSQLGSNCKVNGLPEKGPEKCGASAHAYLADCTLNQIQNLLKSIK